jgi:hypothetical protein
MEINQQALNAHSFYREIYLNTLQLIFVFYWTNRVLNKKVSIPSKKLKVDQVLSFSEEMARYYETKA